MSQAPWTSYDEVPYESHPFAQTHPNLLATLGTLLGMSPPNVERCRVLELGCAAGGNLIPMALALPDSSFVGIDLSSRQIAQGQAVVRTLGLTNIELEHRSILDVNVEFGAFDYVICHGVYSWVPPAVQDKVLAICRQNLTPRGVAYVSYNTYPGWHLRGMIRDMMAYHARQFAEPLVRVQQARNLLDFLARSVARENSPYGLLLKQELEAVGQSRDSYLFHDHLEEVNEPIYFHQFAERAQAKGLRYLGEVDLRAMTPGNYPPEVASVLQMLSQDIIHLEQYMDFLRNRMFRQTLLCHQEVVPRYTLRPEQLTAFHVASPARPASATPDVRSAAYEKFEGRDGVTLNSCEPIVKAAMLHLSRAWPRAVPFDALRSAARELVSPGGKPDAAAVAGDTKALGEALLKCYTSAGANLVEFHLHPPRFAVEIGERPVASPLARLQAETGRQVTNLRHELVTLEEFDRQVLRHLDGTRDRAAFLKVLEELVAQGVLRVQKEGAPLTDADKVRESLAAGLKEVLPRFAQNALLQA